MVRVDILDYLVARLTGSQRGGRGVPGELRFELDRRPDRVLEFATLDVFIESRTVPAVSRACSRLSGQDPVQGELPNVLIIPERTDEVQQISANYETQGIHFVGFYLIGIVRRGIGNRRQIARPPNRAS